MSRMAIVDPRLEWFVKKMRGKLAKKRNQEKSDWRGLRLAENIQAIQREFEEVKDAFEYYKDEPGRVHRKWLIEECADVANRAMMLADCVRAGKTK